MKKSKSNVTKQFKIKDTDYITGQNSDDKYFRIEMILFNVARIAHNAKLPEIWIRKLQKEVSAERQKIEILALAEKAQKTVLKAAKASIKNTKTFSDS